MQLVIIAFFFYFMLFEKTNFIFRLLNKKALPRFQKESMLKFLVIP